MSSPSWARAAGITSYGGHANKTNYMGQGVINALTDVGATEINRAASDLAAMVATAPFLVARLTMDDAGTDDPTVHLCFFQPAGATVGDFAGDAPPTGFPTFTRVSDGRVRVTFASSYTDEYGNSTTTVVYYGKGGGAGSTFCNVTAEKQSDTTIDFRSWDSDGNALADQQITIEVY